MGTPQRISQPSYYRSYHYGSSIVNPPPAPADLGPPPRFVIPVEETWVYQQNQALKCRAQEQSQHVRAVTAALKSQRRDYEQAQWEHAERDRVGNMSHGSAMGPARNVDLDIQQRADVNRAEAAVAWARQERESGYRGSSAEVSPQHVFESPYAYQ